MLLIFLMSFFKEDLINVLDSYFCLMFFHVSISGGSVEDILAGVTAEEVQTVFDKVSKELFSSLQVNCHFFSYLLLSP